MNEVVLDIETQNAFGPGSKDFSALRISIVGLYHYDTDQFFSLEERDLYQLWPILEHAERIIGYNLKGFDLPVLNNYYAGNLLEFSSLDLCEVVYQKLGFRLKLDDLARSTLQANKTGTGLQAITLFQEGRIEDLKTYCLQDVRLTRDLYEFGKRNSKLFFENKLGKGEVEVDFSFPVRPAPALNLTLPI